MSARTHEVDAKLTEELHACFRAAERQFQSLHGRPSSEADEDEFIRLLGRPCRQVWNRWITAYLRRN